MYMILQKCSLWKVAEIFFIEPTKVHYIKEISKKINLAHTSVKNHILTLIELGFIEESNSQVFKGYKARRENPDFIFYKKLSNLISLRNSGLIKLLKEHYPKSMILIGSYDKGEDIESSDIDIFIDSKKVNIKLDKFEDNLKRKIHIIFKDEASKSLMDSIKQGTIIYGEK
jgi:predicted nucleotidyltransferase